MDCLSEQLCTTISDTSLSFLSLCKCGIDQENPACNQKLKIFNFLIPSQFPNRTWHLSSFLLKKRDYLGSQGEGREDEERSVSCIMCLDIVNNRDGKKG